MTPGHAIHDLGCSEPCTCGAWERVVERETNTVTVRREVADVEFIQSMTAHLDPTAFVEIVDDDDAS